ncbi:MAG: hypothetical protein F4Z40_03645 [Chloroflexi bacterium]|nr:hypothetical protein [Chloroflexota bacterium]
MTGLQDTRVYKYKQRRFLVRCRLSNHGLRPVPALQIWLISDVLPPERQQAIIHINYRHDSFFAGERAPQFGAVRTAVEYICGRLLNNERYIQLGIDKARPTNEARQARIHEMNHWFYGLPPAEDA